MNHILCMAMTYILEIVPIIHIFVPETHLLIFFKYRPKYIIYVLHVDIGDFNLCLLGRVGEIITSKINTPPPLLDGLKMEF